jgi:hypothetical protein
MDRRPFQMAYICRKRMTASIVRGTSLRGGERSVPVVMISPTTSIPTTLVSNADGLNERGMAHRFLF